MTWYREPKVCPAVSTEPPALNGGGTSGLALGKGCVIASGVDALPFQIGGPWPTVTSGGGVSVAVIADGTDAVPTWRPHTPHRPPMMVPLWQWGQFIVPPGFRADRSDDIMLRQ